GRAGVLVGELGSLAMNRITFGESHGTAIVDRIAGDVEDAAKSPLSHRHRDRTAGIVDRHAALQTFGRRHRDRPDPVFAEMMLAWRILLYSRVRSLMNCFALSVAFFIATIRELCSDARASSTIWKT